MEFEGKGKGKGVEIAFRRQDPELSDKLLMASQVNSPPGCSCFCVGTDDPLWLHLAVDPGTSATITILTRSFPLRYLDAGPRATRPILSEADINVWFFTSWIHPSSLGPAAGELVVAGGWSYERIYGRESQA